MANVKIKPKNVKVALDLKVIWKDPKIEEALKKIEEEIDKHKTR
jgi:hypothetical protein